MDYFWIALGGTPKFRRLRAHGQFVECLGGAYESPGLSVEAKQFGLYGGYKTNPPAMHTFLKKLIS
jgi:hypothetical protein